MIAFRALRWVMCSGWPLSPAELVAAVWQDSDTDEIDEVDGDIEIVLATCQNLLVVDEELKICRFSHGSVREYFETYHWGSFEPDYLAAKVCLSLLINSSAGSKQITQPIKKNERDNNIQDIVKYACFNWMTHVQRLEGQGVADNRLTTLLQRFLGSMDQSSSAYQNWYEMVGNHFNSGLLRTMDTLPLYRVYKSLSPCSQASLAIATFGYHKVVLDWWTVGFANVNQKNSSGESLLQLAAMEGFASIVETLLKMGADINELGGTYGSALQTASYAGHESIVQLLLDKGADINASGGRYDYALQAASSSGHKSIVQLLLDHGADPNASGGEYGSALQAASYAGHESIVQLLLKTGADANATGGKYGSALEAASSNDQEAVMQLLRTAALPASTGISNLSSSSMES